MKQSSPKYQSDLKTFIENSNFDGGSRTSVEAHSAPEDDDPGSGRNKQNKFVSDNGNQVGIRYLRTSSENDDDDKIGSIEAQDAQTKDTCDYYDLEIHGKVVDEGESGQTFDRSNIENLHNELEDNDIDFLVVSDLSRIGRDSIQVPAFIEEIYELYDTKIIAGRNILDVSKSRDRKLINFNAMSAETGVEFQAYQSGDVKKRRLREDHNWLSWFKKIPFGYTSPENGWLNQIEEKEAMIEDIHNTFQNAPVTGPYAETRDYINESYQDEFPVEYNNGSVVEFTSRIIREIVTKPVYVGRPTPNFDYATSPPIEEANQKYINDLAFISLENYKKSREKAVECLEYHSPSFTENNNSTDLMLQYGAEDVLEFFEDIEFKCEECSDEENIVPMSKNGSTEYGGESRQLYRCPCCGHDRTLPRDDELQKLKEFLD
jgi:hypothetical protein